MEIAIAGIVIGLVVLISIIISLLKEKTRLLHEMLNLQESLRISEKSQNQLSEDKIAKINELQESLLIAEKRRGKLIDKKVQEKFDQWCQSELENHKKQINEIATAKAKAQLREWKDENEYFIRSDASKRSKSVRIGTSLQHLAPYLPHFDCDIQDVRFIGNPIDFIVFDGLCSGNLKEIIFVEVKTGSRPTLSENEVFVKDCVNKKKVRWKEIHIPIQ